MLSAVHSHRDLGPRKNKAGGPANKKGDIVMLRPLGANVVVKADAVEEKTKSGIFNGFQGKTHAGYGSGSR